MIRLENVTKEFFYACVIILAASMGLFTGPERTGFSAFFLPSAVYFLDHAKWLLRPAIWVAAFVAQWLLIALLVGLQKKTIDELSAPTEASGAAPVAAQT